MSDELRESIARVLDRGIPDDRKLATITRLVHPTKRERSPIPPAPTRDTLPEAVPREDFVRMEDGWRARSEALEDELEDVRRIFRGGYLPPIPGEHAALRGNALADLARILLDR